jgi:hypothetical protein
MGNMPFWLKWVALPIAGVVLAFWVVTATSRPP